jgi:hypothetical protein
MTAVKKFWQQTICFDRKIEEKKRGKQNNLPKSWSSLFVLSYFTLFLSSFLLLCFLVIILSVSPFFHLVLSFCSFTLYLCISLLPHSLLFSLPLFTFLLLSSSLFTSLLLTPLLFRSIISPLFFSFHLFSLFLFSSVPLLSFSFSCSSLHIHFYLFLFIVFFYPCFVFLPPFLCYSVFSSLFSISFSQHFLIFSPSVFPTMPLLCLFFVFSPISVLLFLFLQFL